jgi:hypothetical protein
MHSRFRIITSAALLAVCLSFSGCMSLGVAELGLGKRKINDQGEVQKDDNGEVIWSEKPQPMYFSLIPLTLPVDIACSPLTLPLLFAMRDVH